MNRTRFNNRRATVVGARVVLGLGAFATLAGIYAFRAISARPGEGAFALVPVNAAVVASIDLSPSAAQALAFKHIDDALSRAGWSGMEGSILDIFERGNNNVDALRPLVLRNGAVALLPDKNGSVKNPQGVAFISLKDGKAAQDILTKVGAPQYFKGAKYFKLKNGQSALMVIDDTLVVGQSPEVLLAVNQVRNGTVPAITSDATFTQARSNIADDANVMVFVSGKAMESMVPAQADGTISGGIKNWMSVGLAIRDGGIGLSYSSTMDIQKNPDFAKFGQIPPLRSDLFKVLPQGAYGAFAMSDLSGYYDAMGGIMSKNKDVAKGIGEMKDQVRKGVGMDFDLDILPAFRGNAVIAAYPNDETKGVDALIVLDDNNGGEPSRAVERFQSWVQTQVQKEGSVQGPLWTEASKNNVRMFKVNDKLESDFRSDAVKGEDKSVDTQALFGKKTIAWAMVGKSVIASTSQELLDRAVANFQNGGGAGLDVDPKFASHDAELLNGSQQIMFFSLSRIATGVRNTVHPQGKPEEVKTFDNILKIFEGLDQPLTMRNQVSPDGHVTGGTFIPLDYEKTIDSIADLANSKK